MDEGVGARGHHRHPRASSSGCNSSIVACRSARASAGFSQMPVITSMLDSKSSCGLGVLAAPVRLRHGSEYVHRAGDRQPGLVVDHPVLDFDPDGAAFRRLNSMGNGSPAGPAMAGDCGNRAPQPDQTRPPNIGSGRIDYAGVALTGTSRSARPPSSSGLGRRPFKAVAQVRIPLGYARLGTHCGAWPRGAVG